MACYSRDLMRELRVMLINICRGNFVPDGTRSGWLAWKQVDLFAPQAEPHEYEAKENYSPSVAERPDFDPANPFGTEIQQAVGAGEEHGGLGPVAEHAGVGTEVAALESFADYEGEEVVERC